MNLGRAWILGLVCLSLAGPSAAQSATEPSGTVTQRLGKLHGLRDTGTVVREPNGLPHVIAANEHDMVFLQGYVHAQDRLFQMDFARRQGEGTLAELLGPSALPSDVQLRTLGVRRAAERSLALLSRELRSLLDAYAAGVNRYAARHPLPPEYAALEITRFRPWTALDSLTVAKRGVFGTYFDLGDLDRTTLLARFQAAGRAHGFDGTALLFEDIARFAPFNNAATVPDAQIPFSRSGGSDMQSAAADSAAPAESPIGDVTGEPAFLALADRYLSELKRLPFLQGVIRDPDDDRGTNEFVIAGRLARGRAPMLGNDPHQPLSAPPLFYENHLVGPGFDVAGVSFVGLPYVALGQNERIMWGVTNYNLDVTDVYQERVVSDPTSPSGFSTIYRGVLEPVLALPQVFRTNRLGDGISNNIETVPSGGAIPAAVLVVPRRNQGPILALDIANETAVSAQFASSNGTRELQGVRDINRARTLQQFVTGVKNFDVPQNFFYADTRGDIAYVASGEVPLREDLQAGAVAGLPPYLARNGQGGNEWLPAVTDDPFRALPFEIVPFPEMPQSTNPPRGLLVNANNDPLGNNRDNDVLNMRRPDGGILYLSHSVASDAGIRAGRIEALFGQLLARGEALGPDDLQRIQADTVMGDAQFFTPFILQAFANARRPDVPVELAALAADRRVQEAVLRLAFWDGSTPTGIREGYDASDHNGVRRPPSAQEIGHSVAATIYAVWRNQIIRQTLVATLARNGLALTTPREQQLTALKNLFDNFPTRQGLGASGLDFFEVPGIALAGQRRDIILLRSLADALTALAGPQFAAAFNGSTTQSDYRWGRLHRVVLAHPLGGDFNIPPAAGQFPQPLPTLPGIPVDGGLFTVDVGNHPLGSDHANGFMFTNGAARRYVGEVRPDGRGIRAVTSLPGGASGVPTSPFYVNLLAGWLTNETYRVETSLRGLFEDGLRAPVP